MTTNSQSLPFNILDSWAIWKIPSESLTDKSDSEREKIFGKYYNRKISLLTP